MTPLATGLLLVLAELGAVAILLLVLSAYLRHRAHQRDRGRALQLVEALRADEADRRASLGEALGNDYGLAEASIAERVSVLLDAEKQLYRRALTLYLDHERDAVGQLRTDIETLIGHYRQLAEGTAANGDDAAQDTENRLNPRQLRKENARLREARAELEANLEAAMSTMENMMAEYASMYEGSQHASAQHAKNEMFRIRQAMEKQQHPEAVADQDDDFDPDAGAIPELSEVVENDK